MELTGRIIAVLPANSGVSNRTGNPWMSQEYVIEVPGQYPRKCVFRLFGEDLTIQFDIDAREYQGRWFNDIRAYNVIRGQVAPAPNPAASPFPPVQGQTDAATSPFPPAPETPSEGSADDLPF